MSSKRAVYKPRCPEEMLFQSGPVTGQAPAQGERLRQLPPYNSIFICFLLCKRKEYVVGCRGTVPTVHLTASTLHAGGVFDTVNWWRSRGWSTPTSQSH